MVICAGRKELEDRYHRNLQGLGWGGGRTKHHEGAVLAVEYCWSATATPTAPAGPWALVVFGSSAGCTRALDIHARARGRGEAGLLVPTRVNVAALLYDGQAGARALRAAWWRVQAAALRQRAALKFGENTGAFP